MEINLIKQLTTTVIGGIFNLTNNTDNGCKGDGSYEKCYDKSLGNC